jgi:hypothetical protein
MMAEMIAEYYDPYPRLPEIKEPKGKSENVLAVPLAQLAELARILRDFNENGGKVTQSEIADLQYFLDKIKRRTPEF